MKTTQKVYPYYIIRRNCQEIIEWRVLRDVYHNNLTHFVPHHDITHEFVMLERSNGKNGSEYFSNAFTSDCFIDLVKRAKGQTIFDYTGHELVMHYRDKKGEYRTDTFDTYCENKAKAA